MTDVFKDRTGVTWEDRTGITWNTQKDPDVKDEHRITKPALLRAVHASARLSTVYSTPKVTEVIP